ncbi:hypothetical protein DI392_02330 [Vibrio albus]|uniref:HAMP domain-containing protein n=1 Tax=Vibrio albus TaxID=2200953 RepID=A0A2U3BEC6_9VIBR|nr:methyl-accepting chemotaxis protein [Vibrio albus]PWI35139.1 hypothetical protein DI392_02330 [Vibrio albus]
MQLSVRQKLLTVIVPILLALIYFSGAHILQTKEAESKAEAISHFVALSTYNSRLVHELQKERGMSAGFLGSGGKKFVQKLEAQRRETDRRLQELQGYLSAEEEQIKHYPQLWNVMETANTMLSRIRPMRSGISALTTPLGEALSYYTTLNGHLLSVPGLAVKISDVAEISQFLVAYYEFLQGKERAGIERAVLSNTFGQGQFGPGMYRKFITLVSEQNSYLSSFQVYAGDKYVQSYKTLLNSPAVQEVERYRQSAISGEFNRDPEAWFAASTKRIEFLKKEEDRLTEDILSLSGRIVETKARAFWFYLVVSLALVVLAGYVSYILLNGITLQVRCLNRTMKLAAEKDLSVRCEVIGKDELGNISVNLNAMLTELTEAMHIISASGIQLASAAEESTATVHQNADHLEQQQADLADKLQRLMGEFKTEKV